MKTAKLFPLNVYVLTSTHVHEITFSSIYRNLLINYLPNMYTRHFENKVMDGFVDIKLTCCNNSIFQPHRRNY